MKVFCDSSTTEACIVPEGQEPIILPYPNKVTVNVGEYQAVLLALKWLGGQQAKTANIYTDSLLIVNQGNEVWDCRKKHLLPLRDKVSLTLRQVRKQGRKYTLEWISREENPAGKELERRR